MKENDLLATVSEITSYISQGIGFQITHELEINNRYNIDIENIQLVDV